jgi:hypothetical protein
MKRDDFRRRFQADDPRDDDERAPPLGEVAPPIAADNTAWIHFVSGHGSPGQPGNNRCDLIHAVNMIAKAYGVTWGQIVDKLDELRPMSMDVALDVKCDIWKFRGMGRTTLFAIEDVIYRAGLALACGCSERAPCGGRPHKYIRGNAPVTELLMERQRVTAWLRRLGHNDLADRAEAAEHWTKYGDEDADGG